MPGFVPVPAPRKPAACSRRAFSFHRPSRGIARRASCWPRVRERRGGRGLVSPAHGRLIPAWTAAIRGLAVKVLPVRARIVRPAPSSRAAMPATTRLAVETSPCAPRRSRTRGQREACPPNPARSSPDVKALRQPRDAVDRHATQRLDAGPLHDVACVAQVLLRGLQRADGSSNTRQVVVACANSVPSGPNSRASAVASCLPQWTTLPSARTRPTLGDRPRTKLTLSSAVV